MDVVFLGLVIFDVVVDSCLDVVVVGLVILDVVVGSRVGVAVVGLAVFDVFDICVDVVDACEHVS